MRKREFLRELRKRLNRVDCKDVDDVIEYYDELIEDTIDKTGKHEEDVIYDLGPISDIVVRINSNERASRGGDGEKIRYDEYEDEERIKRTRPKKRSAGFIVLCVFLAIITMPLWLGILTGLFSIIISVVAAGIGIGVAGVGFIIYGVGTFAASVANALFQCGLGIILIGLAFILTPLIIKIIVLLMKLIVKFVKWLLGFRPNADRRRMCYEN